jgi:hypothetical protein
MKKLINIAASLILILFLLPVLCYSQKGTIKVFSELKDINVYLDEALQGSNIINIDSVAIGSHYLKVVKDNVIVFGELISVNKNSVTTVLIKDSEEVQNKLKNEKLKMEKEELESNPDAVKQYNEEHLDILVNTRYVTETNTASESKYYPGYYSSTGKTAPNTVSETKAYTNWFITQGAKEISHSTFAQIIGEQKKIDDNLAKNKNIKSKRVIRNIIGTPVLLTGLVGGGFFIAAIASSKPWVLPAVWYLGGTVTGMMFLIDKPQYQSVSYGHDEAKEKITIYNQKLKKALGLPANYESK